MRMVLNQVPGPVLGRPLLLKNWAHPSHVNDLRPSLDGKSYQNWLKQLETHGFFRHHTILPPPFGTKAPQVARSIVPDPYLEFFTTGPHKFDQMLVSTPEPGLIDVYRAEYDVLLKNTYELQPKGLCTIKKSECMQRHEMYKICEIQFYSKYIEYISGQIIILT